jgi:hypothetical protein
MHARDRHVLQTIVETRGGFGHREHLELAWSYLRLYPVDVAAEVMSDTIRHLARQHGTPEKHHATITRAWVHFVAVHDRRWGAASFEEFIGRNPDLLDRTLIEHFYSPELIGSADAAAAPAAPDRRGLPALA